MTCFFTDTHAHIFTLIKERDVSPQMLIELSVEARVTKILSISGESKELSLSLEQQKTFKLAGIDLFCAAGIHPHDAEKQDGDIKWIYDNAPNIVAIGESGLDFHYDFSPREIQEKVFRKMVKIAIELNKPLIIHARSAEKKAIEILLELGMKNKKVLFHCYTGDVETAKTVLSYGWYISISGIATFKKSDDIREILCMIPDDKLLLETDAPFLAPAPCRGKLNTPALIPHLYKRAAEERDTDVDSLAHLVWTNTQRFFQL